MTPFNKAVDEARIWRDSSNSRRTRRNARRRFDYALDRIRINGKPLDPVQRIRTHVAAVDAAEYSPST